MTFDVRAAAKKTLNQVQDFIASDTITTTTKVATGMLEIAARLGQARVGGPIAAVGAVLSTLDVIKDTMNITKVEVNAQWLKERGWGLSSSTLPLLLHNTGAVAHLPLQTFSKADLKHLIGVEFEGKTLGFVKNVKEGNLDHYVWGDKDFPMKYLRTALWSALGQPIAKLDGSGENITFVGYGYDKAAYVGVHRPEELARQIDVYKSRGISRAVLLDGPPGTGKTTLARAYARHIQGKILVVSPDYLQSGWRQAIGILMEVMRPEILLLDDVDRARDGLTYALTMVDDFRRLYPDVTIISTCNNINTPQNAALLRPGRLGARVEFEAPSEADRAEVFSLYLRYYGADATKFDIPALLKEMTHKNFSHDYVRFIAEEALVHDQAGLVDSVRRCIRHLSLLGGF